MRSFDSIDTSRTDEGVRYHGSRDPPSMYQEDPPDAPSLSMSMASPQNSMLSINADEKSLIGRILQEDFSNSKLLDHGSGGGGAGGGHISASINNKNRRSGEKIEKEKHREQKMTNHHQKEEEAEEQTNHREEQVSSRDGESPARDDTIGTDMIASTSQDEIMRREELQPIVDEALHQVKQHDKEEKTTKPKYTTISKLTERVVKSKREGKRESKSSGVGETMPVNDPPILPNHMDLTSTLPPKNHHHRQRERSPSPSKRSSSRRSRQSRNSAPEYLVDHSHEHHVARGDRSEVDVERGFATDPSTSPLMIKMRIDAEEGSPFVRFPSFFGALGLTFTTTYALIFDANAWTIISIILALFIYAVCLLAVILEGRFINPNPLGIRAHLRSALARKNKLFRFVWGRGVLYVLAGCMSCGLLLLPSLISGLFMIGTGILALLNGSYAANKYYSLRSSLRDDVYLFRMFNQYDYDQDGYIDLPEFVNLVGSLGMDLDDRFGMKAFNAADVHNEYKLSYPDFCTWWKGTSSKSDSSFRATEWNNEDNGNSYLRID